MGENQTDMTYDHALQPWWNAFNVYHNIMLSTIDVFVIVGNIFTLITLARYKELQYQRNLLIASLSLSDLSVGVCGLVAAVIDVIRNNRLAHMWNRGIYLSAISIVISFCHVICIAVDRFIAVIKPLHYPSLVTKRTVSVMLIASWMIPIVSLVPLYEYTIAHGNQEDAIYLQAKVTVIYSMMAVAVIWPLYGNILITTRQQVRKIQTFVGQFNRAQSNSAEPPKIKQKGTRMVLTLTVTAYLLNYLPYIVAQCSIWLGFSLETSNPIVYRVATECILANSGVNLIIYAVFASVLRKAYKNMFCCCLNSQ